MEWKKVLYLSCVVVFIIGVAVNHVLVAVIPIVGLYLFNAIPGIFMRR